MRESDESVKKKERKESGKGGRTKKKRERYRVEIEDTSVTVARVIITDFPDLILRTVTRHNSLTQIAHERM